MVLGLEDLVLTLLTKLLGPYIADLTREKLRVGVWSGNVVLTDLRLREELLDAMALPVHIRRASVGRLQVRVPWSRLRSEPVHILTLPASVLVTNYSAGHTCDSSSHGHPHRVLRLQVEISVEDVALVAHLRESPDVGAHERREQLQKRVRLDAEAAFRALCEKAKSAENSIPAAESLLGRLGRHVIDNVHFQLVRVHVRYEHPTSESEDGFACGGTLQCLEICSTDAHGQPESGHLAAGIRPDPLGPVPKSPPSNRAWLHRLLTLKGVSLYWHADPPKAPVQGPHGHADQQQTMMGMGLPSPSNDAELLSPIDVSLQVRMLRGHSHAEPHEPRKSCACHVTRPMKLAVKSRQLRGMQQVHAIGLPLTGCQISHC